jgi:transposase
MRNKPKEFAFRNMLKDEGLTFKEWINREQQGKTTGQIEQEQGVSWNTIKRWATQYEKVNFARKKIKNFIPIRKETLKSLMKKTMTANQMAEQLKVSPNTIRTKLRAYNLVGKKETLPGAYKRLGYLTKRDLLELQLFKVFKSHYLTKRFDQQTETSSLKISQKDFEVLQKYMNYQFPKEAPFTDNRIKKMINKIEGYRA